MNVKDIKDYNKNFFTEIDHTWGLITAGNKEIGYNGMTVSWGGIGEIWGKMVAFVFVRESRYTHEFLDKADNISISFLPKELKQAHAIFGKLSGRNVDKFKETGLTPSYDENTNTYYVKEADRAFLMKAIYHQNIPYDALPENVKERYYPTKDIHTMYICEILTYLEK
jgi:flavin reductase (DIM6/NTAB) family NADH-FMN oxidoreductase RutF